MPSDLPGRTPLPAELLERGLRHHRSGRLDEAEALYRQVLRLDRGHSDALHLLGVARLARQDHDAAVRLIRRAVAIRPAPEYRFHLALALKASNRAGDAIAALRVAVALRPAWPEAHHELALLLSAEGRLDEAAAAFMSALEHRPAFPEARYNLANVLHAAGRLDEAIGQYYAALALDPAAAAAWNNLGTALQRAGRIDDAVEAFRRALELRPAHANAQHNLAAALLQLGRMDEALAATRRALELDSSQAEAHNNLGTILQARGEVQAAIAAYRAALALRPDFPAALAQLVHQRQLACDWAGLDAEIERLGAAVRRGCGGIPPFVVLGMPSTPEEQLAAARRHARDHALPERALPPHPRPPAGRRIRLGYLSREFRNHALAHLVAEMLERHDRAAFEVVAYSHGPDDGSAMRRRLIAAFERFVDVTGLSDDDTAARIRADGIDILVALDGYCLDARPGILARRPAPVQVSLVGYAGTMGAGFVDYLIADRFVAPPDRQACFDERLVHLPHSYLPRDTRSPVAATPARACGLPAHTFVFCCFNNSYKITPLFFEIWMRLLIAVPGSVLWLLDVNPWATANLRREAVTRGVAPDRLVFAPRLPYPEHLARHRLADLFLDTLPYNAHTTAIDALWMGLPVLTVAGDTFAGRVAGSLLHAIGLPELVTSTRDEYEALALRLAREPASLAGLKARLAAARATAPLFDASGYTRAVEAAYRRMHRVRLAGGRPQAFAVEPGVALA